VAFTLDGVTYEIDLSTKEWQQTPRGVRALDRSRTARRGTAPKLDRQRKQDSDTPGIVVTCQNEKSQLQNKVSAMRVLQAKLLERKRLEERAELDALKGDGGSSWGNQMRSYVLHPYQMVKDLRTEYEVGNPA